MGAEARAPRKLEPQPELPGRSKQDLYLIKSLVHASAVLQAFHHQGDLLRLRDVVSRTGFSKGMCFRILHTLHHCGFMEKTERNRYRLAYEFRIQKRYRIGYAAQGQDSSFPDEVRSGLMRAAERERIELIQVDNRYRSKVALRNADHLIREGVDLVIEFQTDAAVAQAIASRYLEAGVPMIAIDIPHPGSTYFGANNYEAGLLAGRCLGKWTQLRLSDRVDEILLLEIGRAGSLPQARLRGVVAGIRETVRGSEFIPVVTLDGDGQFKTSLARVREYLRGSKAKRVLVGAANDPSALGATRAFQEVGRTQGCAIVGQNAEPEARAALREPGTPLIASVGFFPEKYGDGLIGLALDILRKRPVPPAVFVRHELITRENVDHFYPNDRREIS